MHVEPFSREELLARLRETRLMGFEGARVYERATLQVRGLRPGRPDARPALRPDAGRAQDPRAARALDVDIFALDGGLHLHTEDEVIPFIPPVVERSTRARRPHGLADQRRHPPRLRRAPGRLADQRRHRRRRVAPVLRARRVLGRRGRARGAPRQLPEEGLPRPGELQGALPRLQRGVPGRPAGAKRSNPAHLAR